MGGFSRVRPPGKGGTKPEKVPEHEGREPSAGSPPREDVDVWDVELVRTAQSGDSLALAELVDRLAPYVARICGPIALDQAADAAQEALILVFRDLRQLREPAALRAWVRRIATREAVRHARAARQAAPPEPSPRELPAPDDPALAADVRSVLRSLGPEQRVILMLRDLEGLSEDEAARILEVKKGTVKSRLHRARAAFVERWTP